MCFLTGRYGSQRMKDWKDVISCYQCDNLYLAEAAQILMRNVSYEVPVLRKRMLKFEQVELECEKKIKDYNKAETAALNEFSQSCKQFKICGKYIKKELINLVDELPEIYSRLVEKIKLTKPALELYKEFNKFQVGNSDISQLVPNLNFLIENGNTTVYEYKYGQKPVSIEIPDTSTVNEWDGTKLNEIDFASEQEISFSELNVKSDLKLMDTPVTDSEIDWGNVILDEYEIVDHVDVGMEHSESRIGTGSSGIYDGIAKGDEALTILDSPKIEKMILYNLLELESFLTMRIQEMADEENLFSMIQIDVPIILQMQTYETLMSMKYSVSEAVNDMMDSRTRHLYHIKYSPSYVDILTASLQQKLNVVDRIRKNKKLLEEKISQTKEDIKQLIPAIDKIIQSTKTLQKQIEEDISKKYKNRQVNIIGGVNVL